MKTRQYPIFTILLIIALLISLAPDETRTATAQEPPQQPSAIGGFSSNAIARGLVPPYTEDQPIPNKSIGALASLVRATTAKSIREQTYEPVLETQLFYDTDYAVYAWLHAKTDYYGQTVRIAWRWIQPNGTYTDSISPWWTFGNDIRASSWMYSYGYALPLGQWQVEYWIQPSGGSWAYLTKVSFQLESGTLCHQYVTNGGFEDGAQGWQRSSNVVIDNSYPHWGNQGATLGSGNGQSYYLYQEVTVPSSFSHSPTLALYFNIDSEDSDVIAYDFLRIQVRDPDGRLLRSLDEINNIRYYWRSPPDAWQPLTWDLSDFAGQTVLIYLSADTNNDLTTHWYIDTVSLTACPLEQPETREERLAKRFSPIAFIHPSDIYRPNRVTVLLEDSQLKENIPFGPDPIRVENPAEQTFENGQYLGKNYYLDIEKSIPVSGDPQEYHIYYLEKRDEYPVLVYARVTDEDGQTDQDGCIHCTVIQYWLFYYFNGWYNLHEGDWEMIQVIVDKDHDDRPVSVAYSQHDYIAGLESGGTRLDWKNVPFRTGYHPWIFVGLGSHASYFNPATHRYLGFPNKTATNGTVILPPNVNDLNIDRYMPITRMRWTDTQDDPYPFIIEEGSGASTTWVDFAGEWGHDSWPWDSATQGPRFNTKENKDDPEGFKWRKPLEWARQLPEDTAGLWKNTNLTLKIYLVSNLELHLFDGQSHHVGPNASGGIDLQIPGSSYRTDQSGPTSTILVTPAQLSEGYRLELYSQGSGTFNLMIGVPDAANREIYAAWYVEVTFGEQTVGRLRLNPQGSLVQEVNLILELDHDGDGFFETQVAPTLMSQETLDTIPPAAITDLVASKDRNRPNTARLTWTAPSDTGGSVGVMRYEIRYATFPITAAKWGLATRATEVIVPQAPGNLEVYDITGLNLTQSLNFAVRSVDADHNMSELSNVAWLSGSGLRTYLPFILRNN
jgi:hypothetical protein